MLNSVFWGETNKKNIKLPSAELVQVVVMVNILVSYICI